jgi:uncharacterized protein with GYD domain
MPKYMIEATYTLEGTRGLLREGGSKRREAVKAALKSIGGKVESFYYAFGSTDVYVILDAPDNISAAACATAINSTGAVQLRTTVLLAPEEIDAAIKKSVKYRAPGK